MEEEILSYYMDIFDIENVLWGEQLSKQEKTREMINPGVYVAVYQKTEEIFWVNDLVSLNRWKLISFAVNGDFV